LEREGEGRWVVVVVIIIVNIIIIVVVIIVIIIITTTIMSTETITMSLFHGDDDALHRSRRALPSPGRAQSLEELEIADSIDSEDCTDTPRLVRLLA
jgi:hypothetical protein